MSTIPSGSHPVPIARSELTQWSKTSDRLSHLEFLQHTEQLLAKNEELNFKLTQLYASNQLDNYTPPGKVMGIFESDLELPFGKLLVGYCLHYRRQFTDIIYSIGFNDGIWHILPEHYTKREGLYTEKDNLDIYMNAWLGNYEEALARMNQFKSRLSLPLPEHSSYELLGKLAHDLALKPQKIMDVNVYINALKTFNPSVPNNLWELYKQFSSALQEEELASRFKKHTQLSSYFEKCSMQII